MPSSRRSSSVWKYLRLTSKSRMRVWSTSTAKGPSERWVGDWRRIWLSTVRCFSANWRNLCRSCRSCASWALSAGVVVLLLLLLAELLLPVVAFGVLVEASCIRGSSGEEEED